MLRNVLCPKCNDVIRQEDYIPVSKYGYVRDKKSRKLCDKCKHVGESIDVVCYKCKKTMYQIPAKRSLNSRNSRRLCDNCRKIHIDTIIKRMTQPHIIEKIRHRMLTNNPAKRNAKPKRKTLTRAEMSERMKVNNPMFNKNTVNKVKRTRKTRTYTYKRGPEHWLWKGNRPFSFTCRASLYPFWTKLILLRDNFTCVLCGCNNPKDIQVHHLKPLRDIIKQVADKHGIKTFSSLQPELWYPYIEEIISLHKLEDGITVCKKCHSKIDPYFILGDDYNESEKN